MLGAIHLAPLHQADMRLLHLQRLPTNFDTPEAEYCTQKNRYGTVQLLPPLLLLLLLLLHNVY